MAAIDSIRAVAEAAGAGAAGGSDRVGLAGSSSTDNVDFADKLVDALGGAASAEKDARHLAKRLVAGDPDVGIHEVMVASEKASIQLRFAVTLKNRVIEAYRELMRTPI